MFRDFRFAFRVLASRPAFTLVAALSLALGIGANSAIFGLIDGLWFRPLAVPNASEIVRIFPLRIRIAKVCSLILSTWISNNKPLTCARWWRLAAGERR